MVTDGGPHGGLICSEGSLKNNYFSPGQDGSLTNQNTDHVQQDRIHCNSLQTLWLQQQATLHRVEQCFDYPDH